MLEKYKLENGIVTVMEDLWCTAISTRYKYDGIENAIEEYKPYLNHDQGYFILMGLLISLYETYTEKYPETAKRLNRKMYYALTLAYDLIYEKYLIEKLFNYDNEVHRIREKPIKTFQFVYKLAPGEVFRIN